MYQGIVIVWLAWKRFNQHDAWALSSHISMTFLLALFPFLIAMTSLASFLGASSLSDSAVSLVLESWPEQVAKPIAQEVYQVLTVRRTDVLTISFLTSLYFASSGVECLRIGLNRAYGAQEDRSWWWLRFCSIFIVILGVAALLCFTFFIILGPALWASLINYAPDLEKLSHIVALLRIGSVLFLLLGALFVVHVFVPAEWYSVRYIFPGIVITVLLWVIGGSGFGWYLELFSRNYITTYGSLATAMMTLVFLYLSAALFLFGAEINGVLIDKNIRCQKTEL